MPRIPSHRRPSQWVTVFVPPMAMVIVLALLGVLINGNWLGLDISGGRLLSIGGVGELWSAYLAEWHSVGGGTSAPASATLPILGTLGALFTPLGGSAALVSLVLIADVPLAALTAYVAARRSTKTRWPRMLVASAYGLAPAATVAVSQGRLDVVIVHILLPLVLTGVARILRPTDARWLSTSVLCAIGIALIGAFSPISHLLIVVGLIIGFIVLPTRARGDLADGTVSPPEIQRRGGVFTGRVAAVAIAVLLPVLLLLPCWTALLRHPELLIHGVSGPGEPLSVVRVLSLDPGGTSGWPVGAALILIALMTLVLRPTRQAVFGIAVLIVGFGGLLAMRLVPVSNSSAGVPSGPALPGFLGAPMLIMSAGLLAIVLAGLVTGPRPVGELVDETAPGKSAWRVVAVVGAVLVVGILAAGSVTNGRHGELRADATDELAPAMATKLTATGRSVVVLGSGDIPTRQLDDRLPRFGDEQLVIADAAAARLGQWQRDLAGGSPEAMNHTFRAAAASGVLLIVLPNGVDPQPYLRAAPDLVTSVGATTGGRQVLELTPDVSPVALLPAELARQAVTTTAPQNFLGIATTEARLPYVRVRVSAGPAGRLLVLSAEQEPGWRATIDGQPAPIVTAWGHQVAVALPQQESEVTVEPPRTARDFLLLGQLAATLFAIIIAIPIYRPGRRSREATAP